MTKVNLAYHIKGKGWKAIRIPLPEFHAFIEKLRLLGAEIRYSG